MRGTSIFKLAGAVLAITALSGCYYYAGDGGVILDLGTDDNLIETTGGGLEIKDDCKDLNATNNQLIKDFTAKETECDNIEAEYNAHPDKGSKDAQAIVARHIECLNQLQAISDQQKPVADALKACQGE